MTTLNTTHVITCYIPDLPEPKVEPKSTKSVAFLLRNDFQYTKTEKRKNQKNKSAAEINFD